GTVSGLPPTNDGGQLPKSCGRGFNPDRPCQVGLAEPSSRRTSLPSRSYQIFTRWSGVRYSFWPSSHTRRRTTPEVLWEGFQPRQALPGRPAGAGFPPDVATVAELPDLHALVRRQVQLLAFLPQTTEDNSRSPVGGVSTPTGLA